MVTKATKILRPGRACVVCSKSKTKCDGDRPCRKCMLRGMSDKCSDQREPGELSGAPSRPAGPHSAVAAQGRRTAVLGVSCVPQSTHVAFGSKVALPEHTILDDRKFKGAIAMSGVANEAHGPLDGSYAFPQALRQMDSASALFVTPDLTLPLSHADGFSLVGGESGDVYGACGSHSTPTLSWDGSSTASMDLSQPISDDNALLTPPSDVAW